MKKFINIVLNNIICIFPIKNLLASLVMFIAINFLTNNIYPINNINDLFKYTFYGTKNLSDLPIELLKWILCNTFLIYLVLNFVNTEFEKRVQLTILRIGSRRIWINGIVISILISCFIYFILGSIILVGLNFKLVLGAMNFLEILKIIVLMSLSSLPICLIGLLLYLMIKTKFVIFSIIVFLYYLCISIGNTNRFLDKFLIFNQGILAKHYYSNFSFEWSYFYTLTFSFILYFIIKRFVVNYDFKQI